MLQQTAFKGQLATSSRAPTRALISRPQRGRLVINNASKVTGKIKLALTAGKVRGAPPVCKGAHTQLLVYKPGPQPVVLNAQCTLLL
eukprot:1137957-Pelagomonas_calceolata.AAC.5